MSSRVIRTSALCISDADLSMYSTTLGADQTADLQRILDLATSGPLRVIWDGAYSCTGLRIRSDTQITALPGCGAMLRPNSDMPLFRNQNRTMAAWYDVTWDHDITIDGGVWNGNGLAQTGHHNSTEGFFTEMCFIGVDRLTIRNTVHRNPASFTIYGANWSSVILEDGFIDVGASGTTNMDGIHFNGPGRDIVVRNWKMSCRDDAVSISPNDGWALGGFGGIYGAGQGVAGFQSIGDIKNVTIDGLALLQYSRNGVRLYSTTNRLDNVVIRNVKGECSNFWLCIDNFHPFEDYNFPPGPGNVGSIVVDDVSVKIVGADFHGVGAYVRCPIDSLILKDVVRLDFDVAGPVAPNIPTVLIDATSLVGNLNISGFSSNALVGILTDNQIQIVGSVKNLVLNGNIFQNYDGGTTGYPVQVTESGVVGHLAHCCNIARGFTGLIENLGTITEPCE